KLVHYVKYSDECRQRRFEEIYDEMAEIRATKLTGSAVKKLAKAKELNQRVADLEAERKEIQAGKSFCALPFDFEPALQKIGTLPKSVFRVEKILGPADAVVSAEFPKR